MPVRYNGTKYVFFKTAGPTQKQRIYDISLLCIMLLHFSGVKPQHQHTSWKGTSPITYVNYHRKTCDILVSPCDNIIAFTLCNGFIVKVYLMHMCASHIGINYFLFFYFYACIVFTCTVHIGKVQHAEGVFSHPY